MAQVLIATYGIFKMPYGAIEGGLKGKDEKTKIVSQVLISDNCKQMKLNCGAQRHHYSMFKVGRSMFNVQSVHLSYQLRNNTCLYLVSTRLLTPKGLFAIFVSIKS